MRIGKERPITTAICRATADAVEVRGRNLAGDIMGRLTFTDYFFLLVTGREPTQEQRYFLDLLLIAIAEHGVMPTVQAARMTLAAAPDSLQGALAAGILGTGPVLLGTSERCAELLVQAWARVEEGENAEMVARALAREIRDAGRRIPGFGHPVHTPVDPRAERILALAAERGVAGPYVDMAHRLREATKEVWGKPLVMNVSMPIAAVLLDLDFPQSVVKAVPLLARTAGILAHLSEERENPIGFALAGVAEAAVTYERREDGA